VAIESLELGRDALDRHAWAEAVEAFQAADRDGVGLAAEDLERLAAAAWWSGHPDEATEALERAFAGHSESGRPVEAALVALKLAYQAFHRLAMPVGAGWIARAERLLESEPESPAHAGLYTYQAFGALMDARSADGGVLAERAMEVGRRLGASDAFYMAMAFKGMAGVMAGQWKEGLPLLDEAAAAASSGQLDLRVASDIFCLTLAGCRDIGDLERAGQWADEAERWMRRRSLGGFPGVCQVHRAELKMLHGHWPEAEQEARQACLELERYRLMIDLGYAHTMIGQVRLRMGDLEGAADAFERAYQSGHDGQPGVALLQLARGEIDEASRSIARALASAGASDGPADRMARGRLLPAQVDIALAARDIELARRAVDELDTIAADFERPFFQAGALTARGELLLGEDKPSEASPILDRSWRLWQRTELPYEAARARLHYAEAVSAEGDEAAARRDLRAVREVFERLGATLDLERVDALLGEDTARPAGERATRTFMFTDIVTSTDLVGLIGDDAWAELLRWHDRELRSAVAQHRGEVVSHTGDGFFAAFERPADGIDCAVDIQRRLARHRRDHGFAPWVRIGLHSADATRKGRDYTGQGVHVAARVGAAAAREEILVTNAVLADAGASRLPLSEPRTLTLKGVREPVEARSVEWRQGGR
jgi:class 3 adenylate cyclase